jgi:hypothetical protein
MPEPRAKPDAAPHPQSFVPVQSNAKRSREVSKGRAESFGVFAGSRRMQGEQRLSQKNVEKANKESLQSLSINRGRQMGESKSIKDKSMTASEWISTSPRTELHKYQ